MLAIRKAEKDTTTSLTVTANILPCKIQYNGPVNASRRHWAPEEKEEEANNNNNDKTDDVDMTNNTSTSTSTSTAYFRGRKLYGKTVHVPEGYRGVILEKTNTILPIPPTTTTTTTTTTIATSTIKSSLNDQDEQQQKQQQQQQPETKILTELATFGKINIWNHEQEPDEQQDVYIRGVNEWIGLADAMNSYDDDDDDDDDGNE